MQIDFNMTFGMNTTKSYLKHYLAAKGVLRPLVLELLLMIEQNMIILQKQNRKL